jgi:hypothetical protein
MSANRRARRATPAGAGVAIGRIAVDAPGSADSRTIAGIFHPAALPSEHRSTCERRFESSCLAVLNGGPARLKRRNHDDR